MSGDFHRAENCGDFLTLTEGGRILVIIRELVIGEEGNQQTNPYKYQNKVK